MKGEIYNLECSTLQGSSSDIYRRVNTYSSEILPKNLQEGILSNSFYEAAITLVPIRQR